MKEYEKIERLIIAEIENKHFKSFLPSERKLALHYNTSRINIKQAIKKLLHRGIVHFASPRRLAINYQEKTRKKIAVFSFLNTHWENIKSPIFRESISTVLNSIPDSFECQYYFGTVQDEEKILKQLLKDQIDGIITIPHAIGYYLNNLELYSELQKNDCKIVFMLRNIKEVISTSILPDEMDLIENSVDYLRKAGCEHIVMVERKKSWMGNYRENIFKFKYYKNPTLHHINSANIDYKVQDDLDMVTQELESKLDLLEIPENAKVGFICLGGDQWVIPLWDICKRQKRNTFKVISEGQIRNELKDELSLRNIPENIFLNESINFKGSEMGKTAVDHLTALIESNAFYSNTIYVKPEINIKGD